MPRFRCCTTNDREGLIEDVAARMWARHRDSEVDPDWDRAGVYWQSMFKGYAQAMLEVVSEPAE